MRYWEILENVCEEGVEGEGGGSGLRGRAELRSMTPAL